MLSISYRFINATSWFFVCLHHHNRGGAGFSYLSTLKSNASGRKDATYETHQEKRGYRSTCINE